MLFWTKDLVQHGNMHCTLVLCYYIYAHVYVINTQQGSGMVRGWGDHQGGHNTLSGHISMKKGMETDETCPLASGFITRTILSYQGIKTHDSESRGQEETAIICETKNTWPLSELFTRKSVKKLSDVLVQGWNRVNITDPDDPLTRIVIRVRPGSDPDLTRFN